MSTCCCTELLIGNTVAWINKTYITRTAFSATEKRDDTLLCKPSQCNYNIAWRSRQAVFMDADKILDAVFIAVLD